MMRLRLAHESIHELRICAARHLLLMQPGCGSSKIASMRGQMYADVTLDLGSDLGVVPASPTKAQIVANVEEAIATVEHRLAARSGFTFFTLNLDHLVKLETDEAFRSAYATADFISADGWPIATLMRRHDKNIRRTTGADLLMPLCRSAARNRLPVYLFGSSADVLEKASAGIRRACPDIIISGAAAPAFGFHPASIEADDAMQRIASSGAKICFVALGAPKQEIFAARALASCSQTGFFGIGASLDFIAGTQRRAPLAVQRLGMEWAWRLLLSPHRLGARYLRCAGCFGSLLISKRRRTLFHDLIGVSPPGTSTRSSR